MGKTLITGASGFVGRAVTKEVLAEGREVIALASARTSSLIEPQDGLQIFAGDLTQPLEIEDDVDAIYHFASGSHVPNSMADPVSFVNNNVALQLNVLELARALKPDIFVQLSTEGVYGTSYDPVVEWSTILPSNPYAASKAAQEAISISYWRTYGVPVSIINVVNVFGPGQGAEKFIPIIIRKLKAGETIQVHGTRVDGGWEMGERAYEYVKNIASAIEFLRGRPAALFPEAGRPGRWHMSGERSLANDDLVRIIAEEMGVEPKIEYAEASASLPGYDSSYALSGDRLTEAGWFAPWTFEKGIEETVADATQE